MQHYEKINLLVRRKFPEFQKGVERGVLGPELPSVKAYTAELKSLAAPELDARVIEEVRKEAIEIAEAGQRADQMAFFNNPGAAANFRVWCGLNSWTVDEATALLLQKAPEVVSWPLVHQIKNSPFATQYERLRQQMLRAQADGKFKDRDRPEAFIKWALEAGLDVPAELDAQSAAMSTTDAMSTKARASMLKLILGMAMKKYGYNPESNKSPATKAITDDLSDYELKLDEDTVRKYLKEAQGFFDQSRSEK